MKTKQLRRRIKECQEEIANIKTLPYYTIFSREDERKADLEQAGQRLEQLLQAFRQAININHSIIINL